MAVFLAAHKSRSIGLSLALAIALHNIPEGVAVALPVYFATGSRMKGFNTAAASGLAEPLAVVVLALLLPGGKLPHSWVEMVSAAGRAVPPGCCCACLCLLLVHLKTHPWHFVSKTFQHLTSVNLALHCCALLCPSMTLITKLLICPAFHNATLCDPPDARSSGWHHGIHRLPRAAAIGNRACRQEPCGGVDVCRHGAHVFQPVLCAYLLRHGCLVRWISQAGWLSGGCFELSAAVLGSFLRHFNMLLMSKPCCNQLRFCT